MSKGGPEESDLPAEQGSPEARDWPQSDPESPEGAASGRAHARVRFSVLVMWRIGGRAYVPAYGANLSETGLRILTEESTTRRTAGISLRTIRTGTMVDLQLVDRAGRRPIDVLAEVVRIDDDGFSVRFTELDDLQRDWLKGVMSTDQEAMPETEDLLSVSFDEL